MTPGPCLPVRRGPLCPAQAKGGTHGARSRPTQHPPGCGGPLDGGPHAHADPLQDPGCDGAAPPQPPALARFNRDYLRLTARVRATGRPYELGDSYMVIGTSALAGHEIDGAVNIYAGIYANPFLIWGRWRKKLLGAALPVSFQFHHTQMDGADGARFLDRLQAEIDRLGRG